jgi:hypothetical protein
VDQKAYLEVWTHYSCACYCQLGPL